MSVSEKLMGLGSFSVTLKASAPVETVETIDSAGHILIFQQRVDPFVMNDADMRAAAAYVGVVVSKPRKENLSIRGHGLAWWLGDGSGRGLILRGATKQTFVNSSFNNGITTVLGVTNSPLNAGTIESPAGTFTQTFDLITQRRAIEEICAAFGAEYRVNSDWTVDAGASGFLFVATPTVVIARHFSGKDPLVTGLPTKDVISEQDIEEWIATAIVAAEGTGGTLQTAEDTVSPIPFKNPLGNDFNREMVFNTPSLPAGEAATRATELMEEFSVEEKIVKLNLEDFHVSGDFEVGDLVYVWDTDHKLYDTANELTFRGQILNPIAIRVVGTQWRVIEGMGVLYRDKNAVYTDLTDHISWERPTGTRLEVGSSSRNLVNQESEALDARITLDPDGNDTLTPNAPAHSSTPWATTTYSDDEGARTSQIVATWTEPTNTDSSVVTDGSHYTIRWRRSGDADYTYFSVPWGTEVAVVNNLVPGGIYEISVEAADVNGNLSGYATDETVTAAAQTGVPSTPETPTVAGSTLNVQVSHDLTKSGGGDLEDDLDHLVVYGDASSGFTPSNANRLGKLMATKAHIDLGITVIGTFPFPDTTSRFFVVTAVNKAGGESAKSAEASVSATLIDTQHITDLAVTNAKIGLLAVDTAQIALLAVDSAQIANLAVDTAQIASSAITNAKIDNLAVDTAEIANSAITNAKIDNLAVDTAEIANSAIETAKIDNLAVTQAKIGNLAVDTAQIASGAITNAKIDNLAVDTAEIASGAITNAKIDNLAVDTAEIANGAITNAKIDNLAVDTAEIANSAIETAKINNLAVTSAKIANLAVDTAQIANSAIENAQINNLAVTAAKIANATITDAQISSLNADSITAGTLTARKYRTASSGNRIEIDPGGNVFNIEFIEGSTIGGLVRYLASSNRMEVSGQNSRSMLIAGNSVSINTDSNQAVVISGGGSDMIRCSHSSSSTDEIRIPAAFTHTGSDASLGITSTGLLRRITSARKYKSRINYNVIDLLAAIELAPTKYYRKDAAEPQRGIEPKDRTSQRGRWFYGPIADDLSEQLYELGVYDPDTGDVEDYQRDGYNAIVAAKLIVADQQIAELQEEIEALKEAA